MKRYIRAGIVIVLVTISSLLYVNNNNIPTKTIFPYTSYTTTPKKGLAWSATSCGDAAKLNQTVNWYWRWQAGGNGCPDAPEYFIPTFWCDVLPDGANGYQNWTQNIPANYSDRVFFANEPDRIDQCNRSPSDLAEIYVQFRSICLQCKIIAVHISGADLNYTTQWREAVKGLTGSYPDVYGYGLHLYGTKTSIINRSNQFRNIMLGWGEGNKELWISEFGGCFRSVGIQLTPTELRAVVYHFDKSSWVTGYGFFPIRWVKPGDPPPQGTCKALLDYNGSLTNVGKAYANQEAYP